MYNVLYSRPICIVYSTERLRSTPMTLLIQDEYEIQQDKMTTKIVVQRVRIKSGGKKGAPSPVVHLATASI